VKISIAPDRHESIRYRNRRHGDVPGEVDPPQNISIPIQPPQDAVGAADHQEIIQAGDAARDRTAEWRHHPG